MDQLFSVSWLGVIVGAVVALVIGWAWYSPMLFGKQWAAGNNVELGSASNMPMGAMGTQALGMLLVAWTVAVLMASGIWVIALATIAFGVLQFSGGLFVKKSTTVLWIDFGYLIAAVIVIYVVELFL
jgi:hypothetical protein